MKENDERVNEIVMKGSEIKSLGPLMDVAKSVCKIQYYDKFQQLICGTGFFIKLNRNLNNNLLYCLMTNHHVISQDIIDSNTVIEIYYDNQHELFIIKLDKNERFIRDFIYLNIDVTIVEIKPEEVNNNLKLFLLPNIDYNEGYNVFKDKLITIVQFPGGGDLKYSNGTITDVNEYTNEIIHKSGTKSGSSGSPIFLKESRNVLGIHKQGNKKKI